MNCRVDIPRELNRVVELPPSKSIAARALIINALCRQGKPCPYIAAQCDDNEVMRRALKSDDDHTNVGGAGTAMRFLTAYYAVQDGREVVLDGDERMRHRPIGVLVDALRQMGGSIEYLGEEGFPPLKIRGRKLHGGLLRIDGGVSSQFVSALLMTAPLAGGMMLELEGNIVSRPYIDMTLYMMRHYGVDGHWQDNSITVPEGSYHSKPLSIEGDWSAASYWFALQALLPQSHITLKTLHENSLQGDSVIVDMMARLGVTAQFLDNGVVTLHANEARTPTFRQDVHEWEMESTPDLVPTLVVTLCLLRAPFHLTGIQTLRIKESDRVEALRAELAKLGYMVKCEQNSMSYDGNHTDPEGETVIDPHGDHRIAMAMSLAATRHKGIVITNGEVVSKSYPTWWSEIIRNS